MCSFSAFYSFDYYCWSLRFFHCLPALGLGKLFSPCSLVFGPNGWCMRSGSMHTPTHTCTHSDYCIQRNVAFFLHFQGPANETDLTPSVSNRYLYAARPKKKKLSLAHSRHCLAYCEVNENQATDRLYGVALNDLEQENCNGTLQNVERILENALVYTARNSPYCGWKMTLEFASVSGRIAVNGERKAGKIGKRIGIVLFERIQPDRQIMEWSFPLRAFFSQHQL